jgi:hypothetical protein
MCEEHTFDFLLNLQLMVENVIDICGVVGFIKLVVVSMVMLRAHLLLYEAFIMADET